MMKYRLIMLVVTAGLLVSLIGGADASGSGPWSQQAILTASDGAFESFFGHSVALDSDTAIVGAIGDNSSQGAAYVFTRADGEWYEQAKLTAFDGAIGDKFGSAVALNGDTALVGAYGAYGADARSGAVYVFTRTGSLWSQQQKLTVSDGTENHLFGMSIAISGDTALIGAGGGDAAYIFTRTDGDWQQQAKLIASEGIAGSWFGSSTALDGDTALVGAPRVISGFGAAYVFTRSGGVWSQQAELTPNDETTSNGFGSSVALHGDTALVGGRLEDGVVPNAGAAYFFTRTGTTWRQQYKLTADDGAAYNAFGQSVSFEGDTALVGTYGSTAYIFTRSNNIWRQQRKLETGNAVDFSNFGGAATLDGSTALIGAIHADGAVAGAGAAYVFTTSPQKLIWLPVVGK